VKLTAVQLRGMTVNKDMAEPEEEEKLGQVCNYQAKRVLLKTLHLSTKVALSRSAVRDVVTVLETRLSQCAKILKVKSRFCVKVKFRDGRNTLTDLIRSLLMTKKVSMSAWIKPVLIYVLSIMSNLKLTILINPQNADP